MQLINRLLGIDKQEDAYLAILLNSEGSNIPIYTPIIIEKDIGYKKGTLYFPTSSGYSNRNSIAINYDKSILPIKPKGVVQNRRIKVVDEFEYRKLNKIQEYIRGNGAVTFIIENIKEMEKFLSSLRKFKDDFPCTSFCGGHSPGGGKNPPVKGDMLSLVITIYDLKYAIPIFNRKKADGMAVSITLVWPKGSEQYTQIIYVNEMHFIVNSYPENVLFVDGAKVRDSSFVGEMTIALFLSQIRNEAERRKYELKSKNKSID